MKDRPAIDYGYDWEKVGRIAKQAISDLNPQGYIGSRSIESGKRLVEESSVFPTVGFMYSIVLPLTLVQAQIDSAYAKDVAIAMVVIKSLTSIWTRYKAGDFAEDFKSLGQNVEKFLSLIEDRETPQDQ